MSSTEFVPDRRDILFQLNEVWEASKLCVLPHFADQDPDLYRMIVEEGANYAEKVTAPLNTVGDREGCVVENGSVRTPKGFKEAWKKLGEGGWIGLNIPPEFGGQGVPELVTVAARESIIASNQAFHLTVTLTSGAANLIRAFGDQAQRDLYCEKMYSGEWTGTMCLTEPSAGTAVGDITTTAERAGDHWLIRGTKQFITSGEHDYCDNIIHLVLARTPGSPPGPKGISLFIVPKILPDGSRNDVALVNIEHKMGIMGSPTCVLNFGENGACKGFLLQEERLGMAQMFQMMNEARMMVAQQGLAGAATAYHHALAYANERVQGVPIQHGKDPNAKRACIVEHPDVRRMLMHMRATKEGLRGLVYACAYYTDMADHGPEETRAYYQDLLDFHIPIAKGFGTDEGYDSAGVGVMVLGGVGYTWDFPLEQLVRDLKITKIYEGTNGVQALDLVTRKFTINNGRLVQSFLKELSFFDTLEDIPAEIKPLVKEWNQYRDLALECVKGMQAMNAKAGPRGYVLYAHPMLTLMGNLVCAFHMLKQGRVAALRLRDLGAAGDARAKAETNTEVRFYFNKLKTVEYYIYSMLPRAHACAKTILNGDTSALDAILEMDF